MNQPATPNSLIEALERICEGGSEDHSPAKIAKMALADYRADRLVLPPVAAPVSQPGFDDAAIESAALKHVAKDFHMISHLIPNYRCTEQFARLKAFAEELASGFREGRNAQPESSSLAPAVAAWPTNDEVYVEVCRERGKLNFYVSTNAVNDVMAAVRRLAPAAPSGEAVEAYPVDDGVAYVHPQYGSGVFFTFDCAKPFYAHPTPSSPTAPVQQAQAVPEGVSDAARDVLAERKRQITAEGWTPKHDDDHDGNEMAKAAACYAYPELTAVAGLCAWPWHEGWWKPKDERRNLVKAGALVLAEIERLDRASQRAAARASANTPEGK